MKSDDLDLPPEGFSRLPEVLRRIPISRTRFYNGIKRGEFPRPVKISANVSAWRNSDILDLIARLGSEAA